jgi:hypothetical protein
MLRIGFATWGGKFRVVNACNPRPILSLSNKPVYQRAAVSALTGLFTVRSSVRTGQDSDATVKNCDHWKAH